LILNLVFFGQSAIKKYQEINELAALEDMYKKFQNNIDETLSIEPNAIENILSKGFFIHFRRELQQKEIEYRDTFSEKMGGNLVSILSDEEESLQDELSSQAKRKRARACDSSDEEDIDALKPNRPSKKGRGMDDVGLLGSDELYQEEVFSQNSIEGIKQSLKKKLESLVLTDGRHQQATGRWHFSDQYYFERFGAPSHHYGNLMSGLEYLIYGAEENNDDAFLQLCETSQMKRPLEHVKLQLIVLLLHYKYREACVFTQQKEANFKKLANSDSCNKIKAQLKEDVLMIANWNENQLQEIETAVKKWEALPFLTRSG
tara:strand:+ start:228 stop:1178 length:951 start_codon:yes stop_codon:yes gene_type:complete